MSRRALVLIAAVALSVGGDAAAKPVPPKPPAAKPVAKPVAKAAPATPPATSFDPRDPASLTVVLATMGAKAAPAEKTDDTVSLRVTSPAGGFSVLFAGCTKSGKPCQAVLFDAAAEAKTATLSDINAFNQTSLACRLYQDKVTAKPHVIYSALLSASQTQDDLRLEVGAWVGCVASFGEFLKDPAAYLATAP